MGKKKLASKISSDTHALANTAANDDSAPASSTGDARLFVIDTQGNSESRKALKRRQRDQEEDALASKARAELEASAARSLRMASERNLRKRPRAEPSATSKQSTASAVDDAMQPYDVWSHTALPEAARGHRKLARQFIIHAPAAVVPSAVASAKALPDPGQSFNPSAEAHEALLTRAANHSYFLFQQNEAVRRQLNPDLFPSPSPGLPSSAERSDSAPAGSSDSALVDEDMDDDEATAIGVHRPPTVDRRLTQAQRNRRAAARLKAALHSSAASTAALHRQLTRLPVILSSLRKQQKAQQRRAEVIARLKATQPDRRPRLGPYPQTREDMAVPEVALPHELRGSVRQVRVSVNVVKDAMRRMEERGLVEVRRRVKPTQRRYALKRFDRYKESKEEGVLPQYPRKGD